MTYGHHVIFFATEPFRPGMNLRVGFEIRTFTLVPK